MVPHDAFSINDYCFYFVFQFPNFIGGVLGMMQLALFAVYGFKHKKYKPAVAIT